MGGWYGPWTGDCSCCPKVPPCLIYVDDFNRSDNTDLGSHWSEEVTGSGWEIASNVLTTDVEDDIVKCTDPHPDGDSDVRVWVNLRGAVGDELRVIVCYEDEDNFLYGQATIDDDCVYLSLWKKVGGSDTQLGETLPCWTAESDGWHTLLVCHQAEIYPDNRWISALLTTADNRERYMREELTGTEPESEYVGLGTGELHATAPVAEFDDFNFWILQSPSWPQCPDCDWDQGCILGEDTFYRDGGSDVGCEWDIISGSPDIDGSAMRFQAAGVAKYEIGHRDEGPPYPQYIQVVWNLSGPHVKARIYVGWEDANNHHYVELETGEDAVAGDPARRGYRRLYQVVSGVTTQLGSSDAIENMGAATGGVALVCYTGELFEFQYGGHSTRVVANDTEGRFAGLGAAGTFGTVHILDWSYQRHRTDDWPQCNDCITAEECPCCEDNNGPSQIKVTISGVADDAMDCSLFNGGHITLLNFCEYESFYPDYLVGFTPAPFTCTPCFWCASVYDGANYYGNVAVWVIARDDGHYYYMVVIKRGANYYHFWKDAGASPPDCMSLDDEAISYQACAVRPGGGTCGNCDMSSANVTISAV